MSTFLKSCSKFEQMLFLYISLFGLHGILVLPLIGDKAQLSDLLFPLMAVYFYKENKNRLREIIIPNGPLIAFVILLDLGLITALIHYNLNTLVESFARYYLFLLGAMVFAHFYWKTYTFRFKFFSSAFILAASSGAIIGLFGYLLLVLGYQTPLVSYYGDFPLLGDIYRLRAFFATPNMLILLCGIAILFLLNMKGFRFKKILLLIFGLTLLLSFSKGVLVLLAPLVIHLLKISRDKILLKTVLWLSCIIPFFFLTHLQIRTEESNIQTEYSNQEALFEVQDYLLIKTTYLYLKEQSIVAFKENPLLGKGIGNFNAFIDKQKAKGNYPNHFYSFDPHSSWLGTLAEQGILAFMALSYLVLYLIRQRKKLIRQSSLNKVLLSFMLITLIESISMDMLNFRFLYILLGLFILQIESYRKKETSVH